MINVCEWSWHVDTKDMTCRNVENEVTVEIQKNGENLKGILKDMPVDLFAEIAALPNGEKLIEKIIRAAEEEYLKACQAKK